MTAALLVEGLPLSCSSLAAAHRTQTALFMFRRSGGFLP